MNNNLYGIKGCNVKITHRKDHEYVLDYANEVHVERCVSSYSGKKSKMILIFCQMADGFMNNLDYIDEIEIQNHVKYYKDGSDEVKTDTHYEMKLVYSSYISNYECPSEFVYVFTDGDIKSGYIKKEINEILNRRKQDNLIDAINNSSMIISDNGCKIQEAIEDNKFDKNEEKDLYFDLEKIGNSQLVRCTVYYNGIYRLSGDFNYIAIKIKEIISKDNVIIYGDYHGIGKYLADMLIEQGFTVCDTKYSTSDMRNMKDTENILKVK